MKGAQQQQVFFVVGTPYPFNSKKWCFFSEFSREKHGAWMQCPIPKMVEFSPKNNVS
jgi:hypothetical protein